MPTSQKSVRILVMGRVQGVGFRAYLAREAERLKLTGWARNRGVNEVEAVVVGEARAVAEFLALARRGPWGARVDALHEEPVSVAESNEGFVVAPSI